MPISAKKKQAQKKKYYQENKDEILVQRYSANPEPNRKRMQQRENETRAIRKLRERE